MENESKTVYIVTADGRNVPDMYIMYISHSIQSFYNDCSDLAFITGKMLNDAGRFAGMLDNTDSGYLLIQICNRVYFYQATEYPYIASLLRAHPNENTWDVLAPLTLAG